MSNPWSTTMNSAHTLISLVVLGLALGSAGVTHAQAENEAAATEASTPAEATTDADVSMHADVTMDMSLDGAGDGVDDASHLLLAAKFGGSLPFSDLSLGPIVAIEAGWLFGGTSGQVAALLDVSYTVSTAEGDADDARVPASRYHWKLTQKQLVLQPTFMFRLTGVAGSLVPYIGVGPRIYMLQGITEGNADGEQLGETTEQSTTVGLGVPIGAEWTLGPGGLLLEILLQWGPLTHRTTGDTNLGSAAFWLGYRARL